MAIDLRNILKKYKNGWLSVSPNHKRVVAHAESLNALISKLKKLNNPQGYIMKATRDYNSYVG